MPPPTIATSTPVTVPRSSPRGPMNVLREHLHVLHRRGWQDPVPEVEDVAGTSGRPGEDVFGLVEHAAWPTEQQRRVQVALHPAVEADVFPGLVDRSTAVHAHNVPP